MGVAGFAPLAMKTTALSLNLVVAAIGTAFFLRAGRLSWRNVWPFAVLGFQFSVLGGAVHLPKHVYFRKRCFPRTLTRRGGPFRSYRCSIDGNKAPLAVIRMVSARRRYAFEIRNSGQASDFQSLPICLQTQAELAQYFLDVATSLSKLCAETSHETIRLVARGFVCVRLVTGWRPRWSFPLVAHFMLAGGQS